MTITKEGRRHYISGNTYAIKDELREAGCHWDPERRAWWTSKADVAARFASKNSATGERPQSQESPDSIRVVGRATYKGRTYYVRYIGHTKRGYAARLVTLDGKVDFWATAAQPHELAGCSGNGDIAVMVKTYEPREYRGRTEYTTLGSIRRFIESRKKHDPEKIGQDLESGYYMYRGEVLASGCSECRLLGHMCRQCHHDYE